MAEKLNFENTIVVYCDGACSGNPGPGGWGAIVATADGKVRELGGGARPTTNNRMELEAAIGALRFIHDVDGKVVILTDSVYVIRGITQWIFGWRKRGWKTAEGKDVGNQDLWEELSELVRGRGKSNGIQWGYVRGHTGVAGNERCDEIAVAFSKGDPISLYKGPLLKYDVAVHDIPENTELPEMKGRSESQAEPKAKAYSYLSLLGGVPARHETWVECERRVKGRSGAKFKKAMSPADETTILKGWGVDPRKLPSR